jgi:RNA polymerase sigma-54 factor
MKPTLQFRLSQHLTLTPQLQQSIRLLQLSTIELNQEIERLLMENPMLEREEGESEPQAQRATDPPRSEAPAPAAEQPRAEPDEQPRSDRDELASFSSSSYRG